MTAGRHNFEYPHPSSLQWAVFAITVIGCALIF